MKIQTLAGIRTISGEPPRSTAYYYADIERLKRKNGQDGDQIGQTGQNEYVSNLNYSNRNGSTGRNTQSEPYIPNHSQNDSNSQNYPLIHSSCQNYPNTRTDSSSQNYSSHHRNDSSSQNYPNEAEDHLNELSEYVESNEVVNDGAIREVPPLRDRQWSLPEYSTPENRKPEETYSTAGTFPMPEPKEKEPLLAELEIVGRVPLTQLDSTSGVRRSRSWYLCCPNVGDEEMSRDSSWRYSSLRPVTAPPLPGQNGILMATQSSGRADDVTSLRAERDALARALSAERQRAATAARAHDARLAELHGVIAELVRRRAADKQTTAIPEEEVSDECESTTQPAGELDNDADRSRTDQNDTSSMLSPSEPATPQERPECRQLPEDTDTSTQEPLDSAVSGSAPAVGCAQLSARDSQLCVDTARCCQSARLVSPGGRAAGSAASCERERGSPDAHAYTTSPGGCESRQAKLASRVRLRRAADSDSNPRLAQDEEGLCVASAERVALDVCAQAGLREALVAAGNDGCALSASVCAWRARCARLSADCRVLQCALDRATDTAHRLSVCCAVHESWCVSLCVSLRCADRALEVYDVLLALAETAAATHGDNERASAELVARRVLARLESEPAAAVGEQLLSPGPWLQQDNQCVSSCAWSGACEARLREHAARLKAETVSLRARTDPPRLFSYHDAEYSGEDVSGLGVGEECGSEEGAHEAADVSMAEMEAAVSLQEVLCAREARAVSRARCAGAAVDIDSDTMHKSESPPVRGHRRARERHWLDARAAETDL